MKAIIIVGGPGTELRPLTHTTPKPLLPLVNRPLLDHVLYLLEAHGFRDVVLAIGSQSPAFEESYGDGSHLGVRLTYLREEWPLDTGLAVRSAQRYLDPGEPFLVFKGDILTDLDLADMLRFHRANGSLCTLALTAPRDDPSAHGVVDLDESGRIRRFVEKPVRDEGSSNWAGAGIYIFEYETLDHIAESQLLDEIPVGRAHSVEHGLFASWLSEGKALYGYRSGAYWMEIGTPAGYLQAHTDLLSGRLKLSLQPDGEVFAHKVWVGEGTFVHNGARITGPAVLGRDCSIGNAAALTGPIVLGDGCRVGEEAQLERLVAWRGVSFGARSTAHDCAIGSDVQLAEGAALEAGTVIGDGATIGPGCHLPPGETVDPGTSVTL